MIDKIQFDAIDTSYLSALSIKDVWNERKYTCRFIHMYHSVASMNFR